MEPNTDYFDLYSKLQPFVQKDATDIANQTYDTKGTLFGVAKVPDHIHNGVDSHSIPFGNLVETQPWRVLQRVTLNSAQIKALNTTPFTLVAKAPALNSNLYIVEGITAFLKYGGTAFTGANNLEFRYTDASGTKVTADMSNTFLNSSANAFQHVAGVTTAFAPVANTPIVVTVPVANPATGNSSLTFVVAYRIVTF